MTDAAPALPPAPPAPVGSRLATVGLYFCLALLLSVIVFPIYWLVLNSVKFQRDFFTNPPVYLPAELTGSHWQEALGNPLNQRYMLNTAIVAIVSTFTATAAGTLCAYVLARIRMPWRINGILLFAVLICRLFPPVSLAIPYYLLMRQLGLLDTQVALIIAYTGLALPFVTWMMLTFFQDLPREVERAAMVDGCTVVQRFVWVVLPMSVPAIAVSATFVFIAVWNELLYALTLTSLNGKTIPVAIASFVGDNALAWGPMSALSVASFVPVLLLALAAQRYLVRGLTFGAVKG